MERQRPVGSIDRLRWYCENEKEHGETPALIREEQFFCEDMETQLKEVIEDWMRNESSRECKLCGSIAAAWDTTLWIPFNMEGREYRIWQEI